MGAVRLRESNNTGLEFGPKLALTGRLQGTLQDRPVELEAKGRDLMLRIASLGAAWRLRGKMSQSMLPVLRVLFHAGFTLRVKVGSRVTLQVLPKPSFALRVATPALGELGR